MNKKIFFKKKVLITGHTGFKGSWLALWLYLSGAKIIGISKNIPTSPSHYLSLGLNKKINSLNFDICNLKKLKKSFKKFKPDFVFHLAAQSIVSKSYKDPIETWKTNLNGTLNVLESMRHLNNKCTGVIITSDKAYKNLEIKRGYKENDLLGGVDPYGASKSAAEIAIQSHLKSFFSKQNKIKISVARAGNVIGGGDWSSDRLVPDCMRSFINGKEAMIRNPNSTRPWQHVLEVVSGYLTLAEKLYKSPELHGEAFNFGPNLKTNHKVIEVVKKMQLHWKRLKWTKSRNRSFFENKLLQLDSAKSKKILKWRSVLSFNETIFLTVDWYKNFFEKKIDIYNKSKTQIKIFEKKLGKLK
tara:strand:+ start:1958 stop:3028 length:1071 start_codon:yes stop_codon:yes gene_type:complete